jgi:hypothetical protein
VGGGGGKSPLRAAALAVAREQGAALGGVVSALARRTAAPLAALAIVLSDELLAPPLLEPAEQGELGGALLEGAAAALFGLPALSVSIESASSRARGGGRGVPELRVRPLGRMLYGGEGGASAENWEGLASAVMR